MSPLYRWIDGEYKRLGNGFVIPPSGGAPVIVTSSLNSMTQNIGFEQSITYTGNVATSYSVTSGELPPGINIQFLGGVVTFVGTPSSAGLYSFTLTLTNTFGSGNRSFSGSVGSPSGSIIPAIDLTESNVGFLTGMGSLTNLSDFVINTPGTVISLVDVNGPITVNAPNCRLERGISRAHAWGIEVTGNADNLEVLDWTVIGGENCGIMDDGYADNVTYRRLNIKQGEDGLKLSGVGRLMSNLLIHDLRPRAGNTDPHHDGIQCYSGSDWRFEHSRIESHDTSCIAMFRNQGAWHDVVIDQMLLTGNAPGPAYAIYAPGTPIGGSLSTGIEVTDTLFGLWLHGPVTDWWAAGAGNIWSGNTRLSDGSPVNP